MENEQKPEETEPRKADSVPQEGDTGHLDPYQQAYPPSPTEVTGERRPVDPVLADAMRLTTIGLVLAIVSLFIGGILLDLAALGVCGVAFSKLKSVGPDVSAIQSAAARKRVQAALAVSVAALVLNLVSMLVIFPMLMQALQSGDLASVLPMGGPGASSGGSTSIWDK